MKIGILGAGMIVMALGAAGAICMEADTTGQVLLPLPMADGDMSVEQALAARRSVRDFSAHELALETAGQLLWAAQGETSDDGGRTAPSAGALYPLEVYLVVGEVSDLEAGVYRYHPAEHMLTRHIEGDARVRLARSALGQAWIADAPAIIVITAMYERTRSKYGPRTERYVHMEVGHLAQNVYLQAESLGLGSVMVGAFRDEAVKAVLQLPADEAPLAVMPVGRPK